MDDFLTVERWVQFTLESCQLFVSQNHWMVGAGADPWMWSSPILQLKQDHLQQVVQVHIQSAGDDDGDFNTSGQPPSVLSQGELPEGLQ